MHNCIHSHLNMASNILGHFTLNVISSCFNPLLISYPYNINPLLIICFGTFPINKYNLKKFVQRLNLEKILHKVNREQIQFKEILILYFGQKELNCERKILKILN